MAGKKDRKFVSIGKKIIWNITIITVIVAIIFSIYIYSSMQKNAVKRYENQIITNAEVSGKNIDHYISSMIKAIRSVYINHQLMRFLKNNHSDEALEENEKLIIEYFKSVYYASTVASQIYLVIPGTGGEKNFSMLYIPRILKFFAQESKEDLTFPAMESYKDIYIEPTHVKTSYGHNVSTIDSYPLQEQVFTVWLPISDLPARTKPIAYIAIDLPISFITDHCRVVYNQSEAMYVVNENNIIVASSDTQAQMKSFLEYYPSYSELEQAGIFTRYGAKFLSEVDIVSKYFNWKIITAIDPDSVYALTLTQMLSILGIFGILVVLLWCITSFRILKYTVSLRQITTYMEREREMKSWDKGKKIGECIIYGENDEISSLIDSFEKLMDSLKEHAIQKYELKLAYTKAELRTMQAQINPHFIYNVIQCFATNALKDKNVKQYQMISSFGQMLHYAMVLEPSMVPIEKELDYVKRYVALQQMRFEQQLILDCEMDSGAADIRIPKMTIQPLIENAITHGNLLKKSDGAIQLKIGLTDGMLHVLIKDNGIAVTDDRVCQIYDTIRQIRSKLQEGVASKEVQQTTALSYFAKEGNDHHHFIGIENVFSRLILSFGECDFLIYGNNLNGTSVEFVVPAHVRPFKEVEG